jgi:hypothetical protein
MEEAFGLAEGVLENWMAQGQQPSPALADAALEVAGQHVARTERGLVLEDGQYRNGRLTTQKWLDQFGGHLRTDERRPTAVEALRRKGLS